ncbi:C-C motif chemokine 19 isoform X1 [Paralichthys olivaceus]|uniref:CC chemokine, Paol-SCYA106 n=1 Tax=Paralichthys olivaceus TaxID=8255 RepID=A0A090AMG9_PAROL|nr:PREDICTED: C-C motif chemokine 19-like isoform X1 [Paralichthys olivaceus]BAP59753.1 CC chemokine, Paol-SCYA106 [Paralichthys olivaceus]BAP59754.1 CC chemokine, Paol-SCYA106 [Paralichthys olivaceus]
MAPRGDARLFFCFCIFVITCYCTMTSAQVPMDCCLSVKNKMLERRKIVDYGHQTRGQGCSIDATILVTRRGLKLCVPADEAWVQAVMTHVDSVKCRKTGKKCSAKGSV